MTAPAGSLSVMAARRDRGPGLDDFPTPPWAVRALCEWLILGPADLRLMAASTVREPAAGRGHMARALDERFGRVLASDVADYGAGYPVADYLEGFPGKVDWTITNPPFRLAEDFARRACLTSTYGAAMLVRTQFLEGQRRYERLFALRPPTAVLQFTERVPMLKGRLDPAGSTATAYCWLVWLLDRPSERTELHWLSPCRARLEREEDYA